MDVKNIYLGLWILFLVGLIISIVFILYEYEDSIYPKISTGICGFFFIIFLITYIVFDQEEYNRRLEINKQADEEGRKMGYGGAITTDINSASFLYPSIKYNDIDYKLRWYENNFGKNDWIEKLSRISRIDRDPKRREEAIKILDEYMNYMINNRPDTAPIIGEDGEEFINPLSPAYDKNGSLRKKMLRQTSQQQRDEIFQNRFYNINRDKIVGLRKGEVETKFPTDTGDFRNPIDFATDNLDYNLERQKSGKEPLKNEIYTRGGAENLNPILDLGGTRYFNPGQSVQYRKVLQSASPEVQKEDFYKQFYNYNKQEIKNKWNINDYENFRNNFVLMNKSGGNDIDFNDRKLRPQALAIQSDAPSFPPP